LVDEFSEVKTKLSELKKAEDEFKENLIAYAKQFGVDVIYGSNKKCSVKEFEKIVMPEDKEEFIKLLKDKGLWDECSMVCYPKINSKIIKKDIEKEIIDAVDIVKDFRLSLSKRKESGEEE